MTIALPPAGRVRMTNPKAVVLEDLTDERVQEQIRQRVREDVKSSYQRRLRAASRDSTTR
ncbi:hypothetical protein [Microbacterium sp.]|uniref:hypothetical protein n=1 Tax=Microbacterium sp. TaxID=51671 RepID=UPI003A908427